MSCTNQALRLHFTAISDDFETEERRKTRFTAFSEDMLLDEDFDGIGELQSGNAEYHMYRELSAVPEQFR